MKILLRVLFLLLLCNGSPAATTAQPNSQYNPPTKKVLILNSAHQGHLWSDYMISSLAAASLCADAPTGLFIEHLDAKRLPANRGFEFTTEYLKNKYPRDFFDLVIAIDDDAMNFALKSRLLFPGIPLLFSGFAKPEEASWPSSIASRKSVRKSAPGGGLSISSPN